MQEHHDRPDIRKLEVGLPYLLKHNREHLKDLEKWIRRARDAHRDKVALDLEKVHELSQEITFYLEAAVDRLKH